MSDIVRQFLNAPMLVLLAVVVAVSCVPALRLHRTHYAERSAFFVFLAVLSVGGILLFTLFRDLLDVWPELMHGGVTVPGWHGLRQWSHNGWTRISLDPLSDQVVLNALLFAPAGAIWAVLTARPWVVLWCLSGVSLGVEVLQGVAGLGAPDIADVIANTAGAAIGMVLGVVLLALPVLRPPEAIARVRFMAVTMIAAVVALGALQVGGAAMQQNATVAALKEHFAGTTLADWNDWTDADVLETEVWAPKGVIRSDGSDQSDLSAYTRYPSTFFFRRQCVIVTWDDDGVTVVPESGVRCTEPA